MSSSHGADMGRQTVRDWAFQEVVEPRGARLGLGVVAFAVATAFGAYVAVPVPLSPVPMTLQPLFVILAGALLGPWGGAAAMATYLAAGVAGVPVFSLGQAGLPWLLGPTGGYLIAFPVAAFAVGALAGTGPVSRRRDEAGALRLLFALSVGTSLIYLGGVSQLWILTRQELSVLLAEGVAPFALGDAAKILVALAVVLGTRRARPDRSPGGP